MTQACEDYQEILKAEEDGLKRVFYIALPNDMGTIMCEGTMMFTITFDVPIDGALGFQRNFSIIKQACAFILKNYLEELVL